MSSQKKAALKKLVLNVGAVVLAALLFAASFPNLLFPEGLSVLAWVAFIPVFWLSYRVGWLASVAYGATYGYIAYGLYNYWLSVFHPLAGVIVGAIYLAYFALVFPLLKAAVRLFPKKGYIIQFLIWLSYEYLRTKGFVGYAYGISGYSQWQMIPLIQIADIFGVWAVCALLVFPQSWLAGLLSQPPTERRNFLAKNRWPLAVWLVVLLASLIYGFTAQVDYSQSPQKRIALIQHNTDPWRGGIEAYRQNFMVLKRLSDEALAAEPELDLVVWSETAFVPRIYWHSVYRDDPESYELVKQLLNYLAQKTVPFVIGNDDGRKEVNDQGLWERVDYNAVILFERGVEQQVYRKLHLVPFTEHFPYQKQLPMVYETLVNADTHFWKKGTEITVFESDGLKFSTPICFEDTFGYISRAFVGAGADLIVNLTNDAWGNSLICQMQHATMAVFRAIENRRSVVRSTPSGQTCAIDPNGRIFAMAEPFIETQLTVSVPIFNGRTSLYTFWGDSWMVATVIATVVCLAAALVLKIIRLVSDRRRSQH